MNVIGQNHDKEKTWAGVGVAPFCFPSFSRAGWSARTRPVSVRPSSPTGLRAHTPRPPSRPGGHICKLLNPHCCNTFCYAWVTYFARVWAIPGHVLELHHLASLWSPEQVEPPEQERYRLDLPLPQLFVQLVQDPQLDQVTTAEKQIFHSFLWWLSSRVMGSCCTYMGQFLQFLRWFYDEQDPNNLPQFQN